MRVVLAEDSDLLRESLAAALAQNGVEVPAATSGEAELLAAVERVLPDAAIIDIRLPPTFTTEGLRAAASIRARRPRFPVLLLSHHVEGGIALQLLHEDPAGIGYLLKDRVSHVAQLVAALERLVDGGSVIDPEVVSALIGRPRRPGPLDELTPRERDVLRLMAEGRSNRGIGQELVLEEKTVEHHVGQVFSKLGLERGTEGPSPGAGGPHLAQRASALTGFLPAGAALDPVAPPQAGRQPAGSMPPGMGALGSYGSRVKTNEPMSRWLSRPSAPRTARRVSPAK